MSDTLANALRTSGQYGIQPPATLNPLAGIGSAQQLVQGMQTLDKNQAVKAWGEVLQQATDPKTGVVDYPRARALAAGRPDASYGMQEGLKDAQSLQTGAHNLNHAQLSTVHSAAAALLAQNPNGVPKEALDRMFDNLIAQGLPARLVDAARSNYGDDKAQNTRTILQNLAGNMTAQEALGGAKPDMGMSDVGGVLQPWQRGPAPLSGAPPTANTVPVGSGIIKTLTPAELAENTNMPDPRKTLPDGSPNPDYGRTKPFTRREVLEMSGNTVTPDGRVIPPGGQQGPPGQLGTGRYTVPGALRNQNAQTPGATPAPGATVQPAQPAQPPAPQQRPVATLSEGEQKQIAESGPLFQRDANAATDAQTQHAMLGNMLADTAQFVPGPGAAGAGQFKAAMVTWSPLLARAFGIDPASVGAQQSFDKLAAQIADAQSKAGSDSRLALVMAGTPHSGLTKEGVDLILRQLQGNADFIVAKSRLADAYPNRSDYSGFQRTIRELDPRVFQYDRMTDEQKGTWLHALEPRAQREFMKSHKWAENKGLIGAD